MLHRAALLLLALTACQTQINTVSSRNTVAETPAERTSTSRRLLLAYTATVEDVPAGSGPVHLWIPLPQETENQVVHHMSFEGLTGREVADAVHGNRYWHAVVEAPEGEAISVTARFDVTRRSAYVDLDNVEERPLNDGEMAEYSRYLTATVRVPVGADDPVLAPVLADVRALASAAQPHVVARAIYDHVIDTMTYKKTGTGWGNGDTYWACNERYGNCTDFHSLFLSLARTEGIPARFEMGLPIPLDRVAGDIGGYHCWLRFWLPGAGWVPIDASEADKHPERREQLYGQQPVDRVLFTVGRDLSLGPDHKGDPLNYFIYPYAEVDGVAWQQVDHSFSYRTL